MHKVVERRVLKFIGVGLSAALVDYVVYTFAHMVLFGGNTDLIPVAQIISLVFATIAAFFLHSNITWKDRDPGKSGIIKFFVWNLVVLLVLRSFLSWFFGLLTGLYEFAFSITSAIHLPFSREFVQGTGVFVLMNIVTMTINYFLYDNFIFGKEAKAATDKSAEHSADQRKTAPSKQSSKSHSKTED
ncbi:GtrA family protein [Candidatus Saccharibacteria bacterium]|nr:GtrA family protein [Candidatus Saccharibacteria bacterium]MBR3233460.1 GtrA family protein [Candidatus Saccharibacteria bacterium]